MFDLRYAVDWTAPHRTVGSALGRPDSIYRTSRRTRWHSMSRSLIQAPETRFECCRRSDRYHREHTGRCCKLINPTWLGDLSHSYTDHHCCCGDGANLGFKRRSGHNTCAWVYCSMAPRLSFVSCINPSKEGRNLRHRFRQTSHWSVCWVAPTNPCCYTGEAATRCSVRNQT